MKKAERVSFDRRVLAYITAKGTVCTNEVARHFKKKWETVNRSMERLLKNKQIFYLSEMGDNPYFYTIWNPDERVAIPSDTQITEPAVEKRETERENSELYARHPLGWRRASTPDEIIETGGFVCHPKVTKKQAPRTFCRSHIKGQYLIEVTKVGLVPSTYLVPNTEITGGWMCKVMKGAGNKCYYGHIKFPEDPDKFKFHAMAAKDGGISKLSLYVHQRYIYYKGNKEIAMTEFEQQVRDVLRILEMYDWRFGAIERKGTYHMGYNDQNYAKQMPTDYDEKESDTVHFDSSIGQSPDGCTESEIYDDHENAERQFEVLVEHPQRILALEAKADQQAIRIENMDNKLNRLIDVAEKNIQLTELTMAATMNLAQTPPANNGKGGEVIQPTRQYPGDVMYG